MEAIRRALDRPTSFHSVNVAQINADQMRASGATAAETEQRTECGVDDDDDDDDDGGGGSGGSDGHSDDIEGDSDDDTGNGDERHSEHTMDAPQPESEDDGNTEMHSADAMEIEDKHSPPPPEHEEAVAVGEENEIDALYDELDAMDID